MSSLSQIFSLPIAWLAKKISGYPYLYMQLDIINACNLRCTHCYHSNHKNNGVMNLDEWKKVVNQYLQLCMKLSMRPNITLCGGEPLLSPNLIPLIEYIHDVLGEDCPVAVLTNGTVFSESILAKLANYNVVFQVSIDGPNAKSHDLKRGSGSFLKAVSGIKFAQKQNDNVKIILQSLLSSATSKSIEEYFQLAQKLNVQAMNFVRFVSEGNGRDLHLRGEDAPLLGNSLKIALKEIIEFSQKYKIRTATNQSLYHLIDKSLGANEKFGFSFTVGYRGDLKVSSRAPFSVGNVKNQSIDTLFLDTPVFKKLRSGNIAGCGDCKFFDRCGGSRNASFSKHGHFFGPDPGCWIYDNEFEKNKFDKKLNFNRRFGYVENI